eukprot:TRINITY_DN2831_c0_g1_i1.p1 TRINITY_DN2831_c0_g1~~TRINITY_DN2831_c0_g1_i1.p1  ORF type:complete len:112 (-),score=11.01 TRINITY_DN2831_c0_g1_i1:231-566(-)
MNGEQLENQQQTTSTLVRSTLDVCFIISQLTSTTDLHDILDRETLLSLTLTSRTVLINTLPQRLTHLTLGHYLNSLLNDLPQSLIHLKTGYSFDLPVNHLPSRLTHLILGV